MEIVKAPDQRLRIKTKSVKKINSALKNTLKEMVALTKTFTDPEGVGLASTQVGLDGSFFVGRLQLCKPVCSRLHDSQKIPPSKPGQRKDRWLGYDKGFSAIINPKILFYSQTTKKYFEGCLSIPNIWGAVKRHTGIKVSYQDIKGNIITKTLKGIPAWIFQHETDHLNGILFSQRVLEQKGRFYKFTGKDQTGADTFEEFKI